MLKQSVLTLILVCALVLFSGAEAQRINPGDGDSNSGTSNTVPVAVSNFPTTQAVTGTVAVGNFPRTVEVTGTVNVGNLPVVQSVTGSVAVSNLPLDEGGNIRVAGGVTLQQPETRRFIAITGGSVDKVPNDFGSPTYPILGMNRACQAEFPGTTVCLGNELASSVPAPPEWAGLVLFMDRLEITDYGSALCLTSPGIRIYQSCTGPQPVACCGF